MIKLRGIAALCLVLLAPGCTTAGGDAGCAKDSDCKGDRVCVAGACVEPDRAKAAPGASQGPAAAVPVQLATSQPIVTRGRVPQILVDEDITVGTKGREGRTITLPSERRVQVTLSGVQHAEKGFAVYVIPKEEVENFIAHRNFRHEAEFDGASVRTYSHVGTLRAGSWQVVVENSANMLFAMVIHMKVVSDPN